MNNLNDPENNSNVDNTKKNSNTWKILTAIIAVIAISLVSFGLYTAYNNYKEAEIAKAKQQEQRSYAEKAITELKRLDAATDIGINKLEYSKRLIDAQTSVNQATEKLTDNELKQAIKSAMESYVDAKTLWYLKEEDTTVWVCEKQPDTTGETESMKMFLELSCNAEGGNLLRKYKLPLHPYTYGQTVKDGKGAIIIKEGVGIIWQSAKEKTNHASELFNKNS